MNRKQVLNTLLSKKTQLDTTSLCKVELMHADTTGNSIFNCVEVDVFSDSLEIVVADFGKEDDDTVSILFNSTTI